jgi:hypothetical protein
MNLENLRAKLIAAARDNPPSDNVPYAFGKRVLARLAGRPAEDLFGIWGSALWKGAAACAAVTAISVVLSVWTLQSATDTDDNSFETVVLAGAGQLTETW